MTAQAAQPASTSVLCIVGANDVGYVHKFKECLRSASACPTIPASSASISLAVDVAKAKNCAGVVVACDRFFGIICEYMDIPKEKASRKNYAGSLFTIEGVEFVILPSLKALVSIAHAPFVVTQYIHKLTKKDSWQRVPEFQWSILNNENGNAIVAAYSTATMMSVDIETALSPKYGPVITMVGFTAMWLKDNTWMQHTTVVPCNFENFTLWVNKLATLPAPKIFQGGRYDLAYLARFGISPVNYALDTMQLQHAWYSELPKDLASITAMHVRDVQYWKDLADSGDAYTKMLYNALDCHGTIATAVSQLTHIPQWARENYVRKFPLIFPAHMGEMRGIKVDAERFEVAKVELANKLAAAVKRLADSVGFPSFNANSPLQVGKLLRILGVDVEDTSESTLEAVAYKNPLAGYWTSQILEIRGLTKLLGTYFKEEKLFHGRFMYSLLPYGTDTGRNASGEHAFWCGQNLQNIPRGKDVKQYMAADDDFAMFECDSEQAETRDTAYISGDMNLIAAVEGGKDFHSLNCSAFFGVPYEDIYDAAAGKVLLKPLRDLAKRVNHGANYCMGPSVLITTMGLKNVEYARKALQLERGWSYKQIAEYLLSRFHATYPDIERKYYRYVRQAVSTTKLLTGATGWTRYCFGDITQKRTFNSYVAHNPQSLNAMRLDMAFLAVFNQIAMHPEHSKNFVLYCQIHDSIFGQIRKGHTHLIDKVKQLMEIPITIKGCDGITRTYTVPAAAKAGKTGQGAPRWSETE